MRNTTRRTERRNHAEKGEEESGPLEHMVGGHELAEAAAFGRSHTASASAGERWNMAFMSVTRDVSRLNGWLKADAELNMPRMLVTRDVSKLSGPVWRASWSRGPHLSGYPCSLPLTPVAHATPPTSAATASAATASQSLNSLRRTRTRTLALGPNQAALTARPE